MSIFEPDGIENATHNTFGKHNWILTWKTSKFAFHMYCGLHFQLRRGSLSVITREIPGIWEKKKNQ
jgi:hypothetical protein